MSAHLYLIKCLILLILNLFIVNRKQQFIVHIRDQLQTFKLKIFSIFKFNFKGILVRSVRQSSKSKLRCKSQLNSRTQVMSCSNGHLRSRENNKLKFIDKNKLVINFSAQTQIRIYLIFRSKAPLIIHFLQFPHILHPKFKILVDFMVKTEIKKR